MKMCGIAHSDNILHFLRVSLRSYIASYKKYSRQAKKCNAATSIAETED